MEIAGQLISDQQCLPNTPGVYLFLDQRRYPLYIGKSVNLRNRVASYLRKNNGELEDRTQRMVFEAQSLRHIETRTELLALLLEDALIKKYLPVYNIRQKQFHDYRYLKLSADRFPRLETLDDPSGLAGPIFGPFRDRYFVDRLQQIFSRYLGFRSCTDVDPQRSCIQLDLGQCLGPCVMETIHLKYVQVSQHVEEFLAGRDPGVINLIENEIRKSIQALSFEYAKRLREDLMFCDTFFARQRFNHRFRIDYLTVKPSRTNPMEYHFANGALKEIVLKSGRISQVGEQLNLFELSQVQDNNPRFLLDRANLVYNWIKKNEAELLFEPVPQNS